MSTARLTRRRLFRGAGAVVAGVAANGLSARAFALQPTGYPSLASTAADSIEAGSNHAIVQTTAGKIRGYSRNGIFTFKGIPYAASTAGPNRFLPPQPVAPWSDTRETLSYGPVCPQSPRAGWASTEEAFMFAWDDGQPSEDCLRINVWAPALDGSKRPVMFWIHGGGYTAGSGQELPSYDGENLAHRGDVVVVSINHRLNVFGFLNLAAYGPEFADSANVGMLDIVAALRWVRDNIASFGGDPGKVTIFGQSGGGGKVSTLMAMPASQGLFHRAICQSGAMLSVNSEERSRETAAALLKSLGLSASSIGGLREVSTERLAAAAAKLGRAPAPVSTVNFRKLAQQMAWAPVVDGRSVPQHPFTPGASPLAASVPLLTGSTLNEFTHAIGRPELVNFSNENLQAKVDALYPGHTTEVVSSYRSLYPNAVPFQLWSVIATSGVRASVLEQAQKKAVQPAPVFCYQFDWQTPILEGRPMAFHCSELAFVFANTDRCQTMTGGGSAARALAAKMSDAWIQFARTGNPNVKNLPKWKAFNAESRTTLFFNDVCEVRDNFDGKQISLMNRLS